MVDVFRGVAESGGRALDLAAAERAISILCLDDHCWQLQSVPAGMNEAHPGRDRAGLLLAAQRLSHGQHLYLGINPVPAGLRKCATIGEPTRRLWLMVDVDASRADTHQPATDTEHDAAWQVAGQVITCLSADGWPEPVVIDSGNGWHLLYRCDLPNDRPTRNLIKAALEALARMFSFIPGGTVDTATHKANQHTKLPGSWSQKGESTSERPHRQVQLCRVPEQFCPVTVEMLSSLAGLVAGGMDEPPVNGHGDEMPPPAALPRDVFGTRTVPRSHGGGGLAWARCALNGEITRVANARPGPDEGRNNALSVAAFKMGQIAASTELSREEIESGLLGAAIQAGLPEREARSTLTRQFQAGFQHPRQPAERREKAAGAKTATPSANGQSAPAEEVKKPLAIHRLTDLLDMDIPPPRWAIPGMMSEGLAILAGKPKLGKSFLAFNMALTMAAGARALGSTQVQPGDVLYLSLEDRLRRVQDRARKLLTGVGCEASERLHIAVEWLRQGDGGLEAIEKWMGSVPRPTCVVIDVWAKFRQVMKGQGNQYEHDYRIAADVKALADRYSCTILVLHHCKKMTSADDAVDDISGTLGLAGAADSLLILSRARLENEANLFVTGRDIEDTDMALEFDPATCCWKHTGSAEEQTENKHRAAIIALMKNNAGACFPVGEVASRLDIGEGKQRESLRKTMARMADAGLIARVRTGVYRWPVAEPEDF